MKAALGIVGVETTESAWRSEGSTPGAQIDLIIDRRDGVIDLCEMKYSAARFVIDTGYERKLHEKLETFAAEMKPNKALHLVMVTVGGVARNAHYNVLTSEITVDNLFRE